MTSTISYSLLLLVCGVVVALQTAASISHYCSKDYTVLAKVKNTQKYQCGLRVHNWQVYRKWCFRTWYSYKIEKRTNYKYCQSGWKGPLCNIPICNPSCPTNYVCSDKDTCFCKDRSIGENCDITNLAMCSYSHNCYPGSCSSGKCICASGFDGTNCNIMRDPPSFNRCQLRLLVNSSGDEKVVFTGTCDSTTQYYSNRPDVTHIAMDWVTSYHLPPDIPHTPAYIPNANFGVTATTGRISFTCFGCEPTERDLVCDSPVNKTNPYLSSQCRDVRVSLHQPNIRHKYRIQANVTATTGGFKNVLNTYTKKLFTQFTTGATSMRTVSVIFDLQGPTHCRATNTCSDSDLLPVDVGREIDKDITTERFVRYSGWEDDDSGVAAYSFEVYKLLPGVHDLLSETPNPVASRRQTVFSKDFPSYTLSDPGMYSVILTVEDAVGNAALARGLFLWDPQSNVTVTNKSMSVRHASSIRDNIVWLKSTVDTFTIAWHGHFQNAFHRTNKLLNKVKPWPNDKGLDCVQGNRTVDKIPNVDGIVNFYIRYENLTDVIGHRMSTWTDAGRSETYELQKQIADGEFIKVHVKANDIMGNSANDSLVVGFDSTPPDIGGKQVQINIPSGDPTMPYSSRITLDAEDIESGIKEIEFIVIDAILHTQVGTGTISGGRIIGAGEDRTKRDVNSCRQDGTCVCTPHNGCYRRTHVFFINHCWFVRGIDHGFIVNATIYNNAGLPNSTFINLDNLAGFSGVNVYPKPTSLTVRKVQGTTVEISWSYDISCYKITGAKITLKTSASEGREFFLSAAKSSYIIDDLKDNVAYTIHIATIYEGGQESESTYLRFNDDEYTSGPADNWHAASGGGLSSPVAIFGVVFVMLILLVIIIVLALFVVTRLRKKETIFPRNLTDFKQTMRQSLYFGNHESVAGNASTVHFRSNHTLYNEERGTDYLENGDDDELYDYSTKNNAYDNADCWKTDASEVVLGSCLPGANGRFADIHEAMCKGKTVVAKKLKDSNDPNNKLLMLAKMNFWIESKLNHENILHFVGAIPEGPVLLFELCNLGSLKKWLATQKSITEYVEDHMISFSVHTARGMAYLHTQQIFHRRLGARNILLKSAGNNEIVAKISGFGPTQPDLEGSDADFMHEKVPVRWMAPELLDLPPEIPRPYNTKTDMWSFGITLWEMFSKGDIPYENITSGYLKTRLDSGFRLGRPKQCPEMMFEQVVQPCWNGDATCRPTFEEVAKKIEALFIGGPSGDDEYYYDRKADVGYKNIWE